MANELLAWTRALYRAALDYARAAGYVPDEPPLPPDSMTMAERALEDAARRFAHAHAKQTGEVRP